MHPATMFDINQINFSDLPAIPVDVRKALTTRSVDVGSAYLAFSLTILITFMTYYAITLSYELYRTIVSTTFLRSTKYVLPSSTLAYEFNSEVTPLTSFEGPVFHEEATQDQFHDTAQGATPKPQREVVAVEETAEGFTDDLEALHARVEETHVVAVDVVEPAHVPLVQDAASETDGTERDTHALAVPLITSTADIYGDSGEHEGGLCDAGNVSAPPGSLGHEDHAVDTPLDTAPSVLLLPALRSVDSSAPRDDSLQPSAALVTRLSTFSRCADLPCPPATNESDGGCPAIEDMSSESDDSTEDTHLLHASGSGPLPPLAPIDHSCEETTAEDNAARFFQDSAGTLQDLSTSLPAEEMVGDSEDSGVRAVEDGSTKADIMQSAILISGADAAGEQDASDPDSVCDLEWTTVDREDYGAEVDQEPVSQSSAAHEEIPYAAEVSQGDILSPSIDASADLPTHSECAPVDFAPPSPHAPSITIEGAPAVTATILDAIPSAEATSATTVALPGAASGQSMQVAHLSNVALDGYIGPLSHKPMHARVHSLDKPDWAVAPDTPKPRTEAPQPKREVSKPKADSNKPRHWRRKRPQGANEKGADGSARKAPAPRQMPKTRGKDENQKIVPCRAPAAQKPKAPPAPAKTQTEGGARG